jgi:hypothetical protein
LDDGEVLAKVFCYLLMAQFGHMCVVQRASATGIKQLFLSQKSWQKRWRAKYNTPWFWNFYY